MTGIIKEWHGLISSFKQKKCLLDSLWETLEDLKRDGFPLFAITGQ